MVTVNEFKLFLLATGWKVISQEDNSNRISYILYSNGANSIRLFHHAVMINPSIRGTTYISIKKDPITLEYDFSYIRSAIIKRLEKDNELQRI